MHIGIEGEGGKLPRGLRDGIFARLHAAAAAHRHVGTLVRRVLQRLLAHFAARRVRALPDGQAAGRH